MHQELEQVGDDPSECMECMECIASMPRLSFEVASRTCGTCYCMSLLPRLALLASAA